MAEEIMRIDDKKTRNERFGKRSKGLLKKARELAIMCDAEVGLVMISDNGKLKEYASSDRVFERYNNNNNSISGTASTSNVDNNQAESASEPPPSEPNVKTQDICNKCCEYKDCNMVLQNQLKRADDLILNLEAEKSELLKNQSALFMKDCMQKEALNKEIEILKAKVCSLKETSSSLSNKISELERELATYKIADLSLSEMRGFKTK
ncbi:uncharacterized protein [Rutidosis leptorrhynchoides]|uniref:uncharacterized protein isoform X2 n=1 Tax=Rutidosis leptorrhynchoides TaxID=125765 RepID=UPI003A99E0C7